MTMDDTRFDDAARRLHQQAVDALPPELQRRLAVPARAPARAFHWWQPAIAFASVAIITAGVAMLQRPVASQAPAPTAMQQAQPAANAQAEAAKPAPAGGAAIPTYDNDPEFYAWLANAPAIPEEK